MKNIEVKEKEAGQRADKFLMKYMNTAPKGFIYRMIRKKRIKLNGGRLTGSEILAAGDVFSLYLSDETMDSFMEEKDYKEFDVKFSVIYEDENILVVNKPAGLITHPQKAGEDSLTGEILTYLAQKGEYDPNGEKGFTPAAANRLDRNTGGIVFAGKNLAAQQEITKALREGSIDKYYLTLVRGEITGSGVLSGVISKDERKNKSVVKNKGAGKTVETGYNPIQWGSGYTLLEIRLYTGKSHQIRAHMLSAGHPVAGDKKYGDPKVNRFMKDNYGLNHQFLFSVRSVWNEYEGKLGYLGGREFKAPLPASLKNICHDLFGGRTCE